MESVTINGVAYVPATQVVLDPARLVETLVAGYMGEGYHQGKTAEELRRLYEDLFVVISEDSDHGRRESMQALLVRLARSGR